MARIVYNEGVEPLQGIYCGIQYSVRGGKGFCFAQRLPTAKEAKKSPAARADRIVKLCVIDIQSSMSDIYEATRQYTNITHRVQRLYGQLCEMEESESKLIKLILDAYFRKLLKKRTPKTSQSRDKVETKSNHSRRFSLSHRAFCAHT